MTKTVDLHGVSFSFIHFHQCHSVNGLFQLIGIHSVSNDTKCRRSIFLLNCVTNQDCSVMNILNYWNFRYQSRLVCATNDIIVFNRQSDKIYRINKLKEIKAAKIGNRGANHKK